VPVPPPSFFPLFFFRLALQDLARHSSGILLELVLTLVPLDLVEKLSSVSLCAFVFGVFL